MTSPAKNTSGFFPALLLPMLALAAWQGDADPTAPPARRSEEIVVSVEWSDGLPLCTMRAEAAPLHRVMGELARQLSFDLEGLALDGRRALVSVDLRSRPLDNVLEYVLGSVGLRAEVRSTALRIVADLPAEPSADELYDLSTIAYLRVLELDPAHPLAPRSRIAQASIEESRGNLSAALRHYRVVLDNYPTSELVPRARFSAGTIEARLGRWNEANEHFLKLENMESDHGLHAEARIALADTYVRLQDARTALHILNGLDVDEPSPAPAERARRLLVRCRALNAIGAYEESLAALDELRAVGWSGDLKAEFLELLAVALEGLELAGEAGRTWLVYASEVEGPRREVALENAARLALLAGDEMGALFVHKQALAWGCERALAPYEREARRRLGLAIRFDPEAHTVREWLDLAEGWIEAGRKEDAARILEPIFDERDRMDDGALARLYSSWAVCMDAARGVDAALAALREARAVLATDMSRRLIDLRAAELLEEHGRLEDAIAAYEGRY